ncbi:MAG: PIN domain-containing protein [Propionibacteriaceae bacterium]|jgi:predicted nucleic acid-binding protein|nr:PIN domain-containing protein [Propionibacteriaceae bacterium]
MPAPLNPQPIQQVVLTDANVLYSRVLRDYLLYAAEYRIIALAWSRSIIDEVCEHLIANLPTFTTESANRLISAMNETFPFAERNPQQEHFERIAQLNLPDEDDRHVIAAALAAEADIVCTANIADFPQQITKELGFVVMTPQELICQLIMTHPDTMLLVHKTAIANLPGATDQSTLEALRRAGAPKAAIAITQLITP